MIPSFCFRRCVACAVVLVLSLAAGARALTVAPVDALAGQLPKTSLAIVEGRPAMAWTESATNKLRYARAMDANGTAWGTPVVVEAGHAPGTKVCLRVVNGRPAIAFTDRTLQMVRFTQALDATGTAWKPAVSMGPTALFNDISLEVINGVPAIAAATSGGVRFFQSTDPNGGAWMDRPVEGAGQSFYIAVSLKQVQGRPAIVFGGGMQVQYIRARDASGGDWQGPAVTLESSLACFSCSLEIVSGNPAACYCDAPFGKDRVRYVRAINPEGTSWSAPELLDTWAFFGADSCLALVGGKPAVVWQSSSADDEELRFAQAADITGASGSWGPPVFVKIEPVFAPVLLDVGGQPAIGGFDRTQSAIVFLRATDAAGAHWPPGLRVENAEGTALLHGQGIDFGIVNVGTTRTSDLTLINSVPASTPLRILGLSITGPDAAEFSVSVEPPTPVAGGGSSVITIQYAPVTPGDKSAVLEITTDAGGAIGTHDVLMTASSIPIIALNGTQFLDGKWKDFPVVAPGATSDLVFTVSNGGGAVLQISSVTIDGPDSSEFSVVVPPASAVAPGAATSLTIRHTPLTAGTKTATLHILSNAPDDLASFDLTLRMVQGAPDDSFQPVLDGAVMSLALQPGENILAGGFNILKLKPSGAQDTAFFSPALFQGSSYALAMQKDGLFLSAGSFIKVNGQDRRGIVRLLPDGSPTSTFPAGFLPNEIFCTIIQPDGKIIAGGRFDNAGSLPLLVRFHADGTQDVSFATFTTGSALCLALQPDGKILAGGNFTFVNGQPAGRIARLNPNGSIDPSFAGSFNGLVRCLALQPDGKIFAGGDFTNSIARLLPDGTRDPSMTLTSLQPVHDLALQADGKCLVAGEFTNFGGVPRQSLARIQPDGTLDPVFDPKAAEFGGGRLALQPDGKILFSGNILDVLGGSVRVWDTNIMRLLNDPAITSLQVSGNSTIRWLRSGSAPEVRDVTFDAKPSGVADCTRLGAAARIQGGWELSGLTLPASGQIRAQAFAGGSLIEDTVPILSPLQAWRLQYFNSPDNTGPAADGADPDHDGLTNFTEFAFGLNPTDLASNALPGFKFANKSFTATFTEPPGREDMIYGAEWSTTMQPGTWSSIPDTGAGSEHTFTISGVGHRVFVRFAVSAH